MEYHLWGALALGFHAVNIALHVGCCVLLWQVLKRLAVPGAWLAAAIFAVHPVGVESVAWVTEGKNTLSMLFALASVLCYLRFSPFGGQTVDRSSTVEPAHPGSLPGGQGERRWQYYVASVAFFAAALLSKTQVVGLPVVLLAVYWWKRGRIDWCSVKPIIPFLALSLAFAGLTIFVETQLNGASGQGYSLSIAARVLVAAQAVLFYIGKLIWPHPLTFIYPRWTIDTAAWLPYLFLFTAIQAVVALWLARNRIGRGPLAATLIFAALLMPILGFVNVCFYRFSYVADHFQYQAMAAMIALFAAAVATLWNRLSTHEFRFAINPAITKFLVAGLLATLMALSWKQSALYAGPESLYADTLAKNPDCWIAHNNLANALKDRGDLNAAIDHYREALRIKPDYAEAHLDLGVALAVTDHLDDAIAEFHDAIRLRLNFAAAYNSLGSALMKQGHADEAIENYEQAVRLNPYIAEAHFNLGALQLAAGKTSAAIDQLKAAIKLDPDFAEAHGNLGAGAGDTRSDESCDRGISNRRAIETGLRPGSIQPGSSRCSKLDDLKRQFPLFVPH